MQMIRWCCVAVALALGWGSAAMNAAAEPAQTDAKPIESKPAETQKAEPKKKEPKKAKAKKDDAKKADKKADEKVEPKSAAEPKTVALDNLPKDIKWLHTCAKSGDNKLEISSEKFAKFVVFFVSCPVARGALTQFAVYSAKDTKGAGAKRVKFEVPGLNGGDAITVETLPSAIAAREAYTKDGDIQQNTRTKDDVAWITGAWGPEDRPGICAVAAQWRVQGEKAELFLWEEAKECPKDALPKYEAKVDKKPPPLVQK
jgi:hypothetical protein